MYYSSKLKNEGKGSFSFSRWALDDAEFLKYCFAFFPLKSRRLVSASEAKPLLEKLRHSEWLNFTGAATHCRPTREARAPVRGLAWRQDEAECSPNKSLINIWVNSTCSCTCTLYMYVLWWLQTYSLLNPSDIHKNDEVMERRTYKQIG